MTDVADTARRVRKLLSRRAKDLGEDHQLLLLRYANDRMLYRLSCSPHADRFVLKGATLFAVWSSELHRATRDVDLLGSGHVTEQFLLTVFNDMIRFASDDGLAFDEDSLTVNPIREAQTYGGLRVSLKASLGSARLPLQFDVGIGDAHSGQETELPPVLDQPPARLVIYRRETVVAEKLEAAVHLGIANSRMKDFYDLAVLAQDYAFEGRALVEAIRHTFSRRRTPLPVDAFAPLAAALATDETKPLQWRGFEKKAMPRRAWTFSETLALVEPFIDPVLVAAAAHDSFERSWSPGGPWR